MTATNKDIANTLASFLETRGAQWADLDTAVRRTGNADAISALETFGRQLLESDDAVREAIPRLLADG